MASGHPDSSALRSSTARPAAPRDNPSSWPRRARVIVLAAAGFLISAYLTAYQLGMFATVWDPIFGGGAVRVLHSPLSSMLPVPDASLGALGYLADLVLTAIGGEYRWRTMPFVVLVLGLVVAGMAIVGVGLVLFQAFGVGSFCTLCLASAALSLVIARLAWEEASATLWRPWTVA